MSARLGALLDDALRRFAPELLEAVELARLGREDVDDHVEVVHEDPARLRDAFDAPREQAVLLLHVLVDAVVDGLDLAVGAAGGDHEVVGVAQHAAKVELDDLLRLDVGRIAGDEVGEAGRFEFGSGAHRYSPSEMMYSATASGTR